MNPLITQIAREARVAGQIEAEGDVQIDGRVDGNVRAQGSVHVTSTGVVVAEVSARWVEVAGSVIGNVVARERIHVLGGGKVVGDLRAPTIEIASGAIIEGRVDRDEPLPEPTAVEVRRSPLKLRGGDLRRPARPSTLPRTLERASAMGALAIPLVESTDRLREDGERDENRVTARHRPPPAIPHPAPHAKLVPKKPK
jgi:cytoskeletal protein CcmA (bactofilin family)